MKKQRIVKLKKKHQLPASIVAIASILNAPLKKSDAVVIFTGQGEEDRLLHGINLFKEKYGDYLLVADVNQEEKKRFGEYKKEEIVKLCGNNINTDQIFVAKEKGESTLEQAKWISGVLKSLDAKEIIIVTRTYHLPRTIMTIIKTFQQNGQKILIRASCPNTLLSSETILIPGEIQRIKRYQQKGDIANLKEIKDYLLK